MTKRIKQIATSIWSGHQCIVALVENQTNSEQEIMLLNMFENKPVWRKLPDIEGIFKS